jgi:ATP-dependent Zn protease
MSNAQQQTAPASTAPKQREVTCTHEAGHAVVACLLVGGIGGVRLEPNGGGLVWRGPTPKPDAVPATEEKWRERFADNEDLLFVCGPVPFSIVSQHLAKWRSEAIISLAGPEAERLAFGLVVSPPSSDQLSAKTFTRRCSVSRAGANALLEHCRLEARAILKTRWPAVEPIARALDQEDELDGEEVARLIAQNPPLR